MLDLRHVSSDNNRQKKTRQKLMSRRVSLLILIVALGMVVLLTATSCPRLRIPAVYINLDRRPDRRMKCHAQLSRNFTRFRREKAVDGRLESSTRTDQRVVPYYDLAENAQWDGNIRWKNRTLRMSASEIGCGLSHISVWERQNDTPFAVFEDDVVLTYRFRTKLRRFMAIVPRDWDILYLGYINTDGLDATSIPGVKRVVFVFGAYAYVLSQSGLEKVRNLLPVDRPVDNFLGKLTETGQLVGYAPSLPLADQIQYGGPGSDITHSAHALPN